MTLRSLGGKLGLIFKPFALISDMALHAVGYRASEERDGQPIPVKLAVRSALLLVPVYLVASFFAGMVMDSTGIQVRFHFYIWHPYFYIWDGLLTGLWGLIGFLLAPLQVQRVLRLNRRARRHRLTNLERMAKRETAIEENTLSLAHYEVQESPIQLVSQGN